MASYRGQNLFKGIVSEMNEHGDLRINHLTVTDGHDQLRPALEALNETQAAHGFPQIETVACTDKPAEEVAFFESVFPAVKELRLRLEAERGGGVSAEGAGGRGGAGCATTGGPAAGAARGRAHQEAVAGLNEVDGARIKFTKYLTSPASISTACDAARDVVGALPAAQQ
eukprot:804525-Prymnesium_polylepis.1